MNEPSPLGRLQWQSGTHRLTKTPYSCHALGNSGETICYINNRHVKKVIELLHRFNRDHSNYWQKMFTLSENDEFADKKSWTLISLNRLANDLVRRVLNLENNLMVS